MKLYEKANLAKYRKLSPVILPKPVMNHFNLLCAVEKLFLAKSEDNHKISKTILKFQS